MKYMIPGTNWAVSYNAPVTLTFSILCLLALVVNYLTAGLANTLLFSCYRSSFLNPLTYVRLFGHVLGHANWQHLIGNLTLFLVLGTSLESRYGSRNLLMVILLTALVIGGVQMLFFSNTAVLGASGVVFAFIILASVGVLEGEHTIPLTLILVMFLYLGTEVWKMVTVKDNVSQVSHVIGGLVGALCGFLL